jgi:hypothetical protein
VTSSVNPAPDTLNDRLSPHAAPAFIPLS